MLSSNNGYPTAIKSWKDNWDILSAIFTYPPAIGKIIYITSLTGVGGMCLPTAFWSNTIWYLLLSIISIVSIGFILYKSNNRKFDIGFGLAMLGATFHAEFALLVAFNAYRYSPQIFNDPFFDAVLGNYVSQISVATSIGLVVIYKLPGIWSFIIPGIYFIIDILFVNLGIYQHFWYKSWYTFILALLALLIAKKWYYRVLNYPTPLYYLTLHMGARALFSLVIVFKYFFSLEVINIFIFDEFSRNQAFFMILYDSFWIMIMMIVHGLDTKWMGKGIFLVLLFIIQYVLIKTAGIITVKNGWFLVITLFNIFGSYIAVVVTDYLLRKGIAVNAQTK